MFAKCRKQAANPPQPFSKALGYREALVQFAIISDGPKPVWRLTKNQKDICQYTYPQSLRGRADFDIRLNSGETLKLVDKGFFRRRFEFWVNGDKTATLNNGFTRKYDAENHIELKKRIARIQGEVAWQYERGEFDWKGKGVYMHWSVNETQHELLSIFMGILVFKSEFIRSHGA